MDLKQLEDGGQLGQTLESWVVSTVNEWRDVQEDNYFHKWDEYYRIWRGIWADEDKTRQSERSKLISPATQQAVESSVSELEEATFGRGSFFDIDDDMGDQERQDIEFLKNKLATEFKRNNIRKDTAECILNAAVFGTGIAEIVVDYETYYTPKEQEDDDGLRVIGRNEESKMCAKMRPIKPHNFRIPDIATDIESALGVAVEEYVAPDYVFDLQERGVYMDTDVVLQSYASDEDLEADPTIDNYDGNKVKLVRYYGKVPRHLLEDVEGFEPNQNHTDSYYVEAQVVVANDGILLKASNNPYLMNDRPIVAFQWDIVPGRFWGRGVCEKGYNPQKALDAELRQRRDAMSMNVAPMLGIDATRLPMLGQKLQIQPGKQVLVNGDPREILHPFRFGDLPQTSYVETESLQNMVQMATGAVDSAGIAGQINGEATAAGISMSLGAIIKRHKRTLINFQESFLIPFVQKCAYRYMQFDGDNFPVRDYNFTVSSSLGIMAREYEVGQMTQLLQTMSQDSPIYGTVLKSIIDNMNISNREALIAQIDAANQPSPEAQAAQQAAEQRAQEIHQAQIALIAAQAAEAQARAAKYKEETRLEERRLQIELIEAATDINNDAGDEFAQVMEAAKFRHQQSKDKTDAELRNKALDIQRAQRENANGSKQSGIQSGNGTTQ